MKKEFEDIIKSAEKKLNNMKVSDLFGNKLKFNLGKGQDCSWMGKNSNLLTSSIHSGQYWCAKSDTLLTGSFDAKVTFNNISNIYTNSDWYYWSNTKFTNNLFQTSSWEYSKEVPF